MPRCYLNTRKARIGLVPPFLLGAGDLVAVGVEDDGTAAAGPGVDDQQVGSGHGSALDFDEACGCRLVGDEDADEFPAQRRVDGLHLVSATRSSDDLFRARQRSELHTDHPVMQRRVERFSAFIVELAQNITYHTFAAQGLPFIGAGTIE